MAEFTPDYTTYSTCDLLNALALLDRECFRDRLVQIRAELRLRGVNYVETPKIVEGIARYHVQVIAEPSPCAQSAEPSHAIEQMDNSNEIAAKLRIQLVGFLGSMNLWWIFYWFGNFRFSILALLLIFAVVCFALCRWIPPIFKNVHVEFAQNARNKLMIMLFFGVTLIPFALMQIHYFTTDFAKQSAVVLDTYHGAAWKCRSRLLLQIKDEQVEEVCQVPTHILDKLRPNDQVQIMQQRSIFGVSTEKTRILFLSGK